MSDPTTLRACGAALRHLHEREPVRRTLHLADWCERRVKQIRAERRELRTEDQP